MAVRWGVSGIIVLVFAAGLFWWQQPQAPTASAPGGQGADRQVVAVEAAPVETGAISARITFTGSLSPASQFAVASRIPGRLVRLYADLGDSVEPGQVIARLDDEESVQQLEQARAELAVARAGLAEAEASLEAAERSLRRTRELRQQRVASQSELDAAETEVRAQSARLDLSRSQISQQQASVRAAEIRLSYTTLRASWHGDQTPRLVAERYADEGIQLQANTPVVTLVALDPLRGVVFAAEQDYARLRTGQPVTVTSDPLPGRVFEGRISRLAPVFREASRQARVEINVPNPDHLLKPGMFIRAQVEVASRDNATLVPIDALVERDGRHGVFSISDDGEHAEFVAVERGIEEAGRVEILSPALSGRVVTLGQHMLSDGLRIRVAGDDARNDG
ncbi:MAG: efflux RND transporter periplasmic adaptor subunit [Aquisalimonadaceae bacterium]